MVSNPQAGQPVRIRYGRKARDSMPRHAGGGVECNHFEQFFPQAGQAPEPIPEPPKGKPARGKK